MDVVTFGESIIVFSPQSHVPLRHVHTFEKTIGGAESNIKLGSEGCSIKSKEESCMIPGYNVSDIIIDTVGAGDGFAAGFLCGYLDNLYL